MPDIKVPHLDKSFTAQIGTAEIDKLNQVLLYICKGLDGESVKKKVKNNEPLTEQELHAGNLVAFLTAIYKQAESSGRLVYKSPDITVNS